MATLLLRQQSLPYHKRESLHQCLSKQIKQKVEVLSPFHRQENLLKVRGSRHSQRSESNKFQPGALLSRTSQATLPPLRIEKNKHFLTALVGTLRQLSQFLFIIVTTVLSPSPRAAQGHSTAWSRPQPQPERTPKADTQDHQHF